MERKRLTKTVMLIFCLSILITGVVVGTGMLAKASQSQTKTVKEERTTPDEEKQDQNITDKEPEKILSRYETTAKSEETRDQNLKVSCEKLNGTELQPGEVLSFNAMAGPFTEEEGYLEGPAIISEGQMGRELGGGVCQVSTTLYNAALLGNLGIAERHRHSFPMDYVDVGLDAMINEPDSDLKIQNTTDVPLYIEAFAQDGTVMIQFKGAELDARTEVHVESSVLNTILPEGEEIRLSADLEDGARQVLQEERNGYETRVYRKVYNDGRLISEEVLSEDTYPPIRRIVLEGCQQSK